MIFTEVLLMALRSLGMNRLRSALTMLGIAIGVFSVMGVMTAVSAMRGSIETGLSMLGSDTFQFTRASASFGPGGGQNARRYANRPDITLAQAQRYRERMSGVASAISITSTMGGSQASYEGLKTSANLSLRGTNEDFLAANKFEMETGRNFTADDVIFARPVAIIGQELVDSLFPTQSPLNRRILVRDRVYTVIGTLESKGSAFGATQDGIVLIPVTRFLSDFGAAGRSLTIATQAPAQELYNDTLDRAISAMRVVRSLRAVEENDFEISSNASLLSAFASVADTLQVGSLAISAVALLAAGVGIMNIMLVSVTERTKEIGIRRSIGARKSSILTQFLVEAVVISLAGGMLGVLAGVAGGNGVAVLLNAAVVIPWNWAAAGMGVCCAIGVGFGYYPAHLAASLDPIEALRFE